MPLGRLASRKRRQEAFWSSMLGGTLLLGREPGLDERAERPLPFVVPEFAPGDFPFC